ncbi:MAG: caspase family protein [Betaproteobacteria bacterium]|nr:caspase family protein [Betaproteobacteria bacterium]
MRSTARLLAQALKTNVCAGTRLALFRRVSALDFRISAGHYAVLAMASLAFWLAGGMVREGFPGALDLSAFTVALAQIPLILCSCLLLAWIFGRSSLLIAFAVLFTSSDLVFEIVGTAVQLVFRDPRFAEYAGTANLIYIAWALATLLRSQWVLTGWRPPRSLAAGGVVTLTLALFVWVFPRTEGWARLEVAPRADSQPSVVREDLFHLQGGLLEARVSELQAERPDVEDIYFIGIAPYGLQDTFIRELQVVKKLMDERFDTAGRSLALVNHPATLAELPIATASNLRTAIAQLAGGIDTEEDVLFLYFSTHGNEAGELAFELPPLKLQQLTPTALSRMLNDAGVKWKAIVISACYSGSYIEPLRDDYTLVITASDASHPSFGCEPGSDFTWFGRAFFDQALRRTYSLTEAFEQAKRTVAERERAQGFEASNPQLFIGPAMREKLASIQRRLEAAAPSASIRAAR